MAASMQHHSSRSRRKGDRSLTGLPKPKPNAGSLLRTGSVRGIEGSAVERPNRITRKKERE